MDIETLVEALNDSPHFVEVTATTPHGTYTFDVVAVEGGVMDPVLRLVERREEREDPEAPASVIDSFGDIWVRNAQGTYDEYDGSSDRAGNYTGWTLEQITRVWGIKP